MVERKNRDRTSRSQGSQPVVFENATVDALAGMVLALLGEVMVLKDRLDANERMLEAAGLHGPSSVDAFAPDEAARAHRGVYRQATYDRVLGVARDKLLPHAFHEQKAYEGELQTIAAD